MKKLIIALTAATLIGFSCKDSSQKVEDKEKNVEQAKQELDKANIAYQQELENYRKETNDRIAANDVTITEFNARIENEKKEIKADYKRRVNELELKNKEMKRKLSEYKDEGKDNWEKFKKEFNHDMDELGQALKDLTKDNVK